MTKPTALLALLLVGCTAKQDAPLVVRHTRGTMARSIVYATTAELLDGSWSVVEPEHNPAVPALAPSLVGHGPISLIFTRNGMVTFRANRTEVHGRWSSSGQNVKLAWEDIDGIRIDKFEANVGAADPRAPIDDTVQRRVVVLSFANESANLAIASNGNLLEATRDRPGSGKQGKGGTIVFRRAAS